MSVGRWTPVRIATTLTGARDQRALLDVESAKCGDVRFWQKIACQLLEFNNAKASSLPEYLQRMQ
jgi:hypothetical protein